MAGTGRNWQELAGNGWKYLEMAGMAKTWLEIAGNGWKWLEMLKVAEDGRGKINFQIVLQVKTKSQMSLFQTSYKLIYFQHKKNQTLVEF